MTAIEVEGFFWLPGSPNEEVAGRLIFDRANGGKLHLIGSLDEEHDVSRIVGRSNDGYYTLEDCFATNTSTNFAMTTRPFARQTFHVGRIYGGVAYDQGEEPFFDSAEIGLSNLIEWVGPPHIRDETRFGHDSNGNPHVWSVTLDAWDERHQAGTTGRVALRQFRGVDGDGLRLRSLTQSVSFILTLENRVPVARAIEIASDLQDLVSIGTDGVAAYEYFHLTDSDLNAQEPVRLLAPWHAQIDPGAKRLHQSDMAFTFDDLGGMSGVTRWLEVADKYRSMLRHVMTTRYVKTFADVKLQFRVAALNGFFKKWRGYERDLQKELLRLAELAGDPFAQLVPDVEAWCEKVKQERHNLSHHYGNSTHASSADLFYSSEATYLLFVLCMLRLADAPDKVFHRLVKSPQFTWLQGRLAARP